MAPVSKAEDAQNEVKKGEEDKKGEEKKGEKKKGEEKKVEEKKAEVKKGEEKKGKEEKGEEKKVEEKKAEEKKGEEKKVEEKKGEKKKGEKKKGEGKKGEVKKGEEEKGEEEKGEVKKGEEKKVEEKKGEKKKGEKKKGEGKKVEEKKAEEKKGEEEKGEVKKGEEEKGEVKKGEKKKGEKKKGEEKKGEEKKVEEKNAEVKKGEEKKVEEKKGEKKKGEEKKGNTTELKGLESLAPLVRSVEETPDAIHAEVQGTIPHWINGSLLRNGPAKFEFGDTSFNHWFDGMAMLHKFKMEKGQVTYTSRFLRSEAYKKNSERDRIMVSEFGTVAMPDPCQNIFQRFFSRFEMIKPTDNANVNFMKYKGDYYVSTETNLIHKVNPENLETLQQVDWSTFVAVNGATAHPHYDPDGTCFNMGNSYEGKGTTYNIIRVPPGKSNDYDTLQGASILCSIAPSNKSHPSYYHSFAMSENYVVFIEQPIKIDLVKIVTCKLRGKAFSDAVYWDPKQDTILHLIDKKTGEASPVKYYAKAFSNFHQINAFEESGFLILDLCCADDGKALDIYTLQNLRKSGEALDKLYNNMSKVFPRRFVLPLQVSDDTPIDKNLNTRPSSKATCVKKSKTRVFCQSEDLHGDDLYQYGGLEFPHINYKRYNTRPYRYFYGCGFKHLFGDSLLKMDLNDRTLKVWYQKGLFPSEPVFVPSPNAVEEDDGVILSVVLCPSQDKATFLLVLNAKTFEELGRANVPVNMPYGFHGVFNASVQ
ncbi:carotenoid-cleaving dioxygenase, mitochondrial-like isoform X8 [Hippocampus zosterae]|uniref:carotenoid-cleaving dioxygenase, mitochondrial-like isoform X8 n=1 Tax=Hippocampus zosterae TaxID=109293 RepID=UPI00223E8439|nr:carotenoid-cleaving dioxygenase, mitochondrial-like isoform X8 [Hippocampus zosterae]